MAATAARPATVMELPKELAAPVKVGGAVGLTGELEFELPLP